ncbi:hypothetical protein [Stenotrophomonas mori]|uniref:Uncharacterized protein n=1 Tax=Stenotrophomonas mori TaxID=2871096 RepID=A0ABT0SCU4_9GAMM|nr:hypothetical protein [Stenotrophomonas mori]MCL7713112.1 hypothetical protein [Stenotrophomonas mori]
MSRPRPSLHRERVLIAQEAARLVRESGIDDLDQALRRAAARLGVRDDARWPRVAQVEDILREQQRLFDSASQPAALHRHRDAALQAMQFLADFEPRLTGAVLAGTADAGTAVVLHLHCDDSAAVQRLLDEHGIPAVARTWHLQLAGQTARAPFPGWSFIADEVPFELVVLPEAALRQPPVAREDGKPLPRATLAQMRRRLAGPGE